MRTLIAVSLLVCCATAAVAAAPPERLSYQGVLRNSSGAPIDADRDMVFRFFDAETVGNEILVDTHASAGTGGVTVSGGLFRADLGGGTVGDGSGPGTFGTLLDVFRDHGDVWLEIEVQGEVLSPRVRVASSGYALNAAHLDGMTAGNFVDTSATSQFKEGELVTGASTGLGDTCGVEGYGPDAGGYFKDSNESGYAYVGRGDYGIRSFGNQAGGYFKDADQSGYALVGSYDNGVQGYGTNAGGVFEDSDNTGKAFLGWGDTGVYAYGSTRGGNFVDTDGSGYAWVGSGDRGIEGFGNDAGGYFYDLDQFSYAFLAHDAYGVEGHGTGAGGYFKSSSGTGHAYVGYNDWGLRSLGTLGGGLFEDQDQSGYAWVASYDNGIQAFGNNAGGIFTDADGTGLAYVGYDDLGIWAQGSDRGGLFLDTDGSGTVSLARGDLGVEAEGEQAGGYFEDTSDSGFAHVGYGDRGIEAHGTDAGGSFVEIDGGANALLGYQGQGIEASGSAAGGHFHDSDGSGEARLGYGNRGVDAHGTEAGGYFQDDDGSGYAYVGYGNTGIVGHGDTGISGHGVFAGGSFYESDTAAYTYIAHANTGILARGALRGGTFLDTDQSGTAYLAAGDVGVEGRGNLHGGYFQDLDQTGYAYLGTGNEGIQGYGSLDGGYFGNLSTSSYARLVWSGYKIFGSGTMAFVQNHPHDDRRVIVYAAPEGDEVATYTRGSGRLVDGEARVALGPTFALVTNPDLGLTAHLTARGEAAELYVAELSTSEIVVRGPAGSKAAFDFLVYGLRLGFEEISILQPKQDESRIPSLAEHQRFYAEDPELRSANAFERFKNIEQAVRGRSVDLSRSETLKAAVGVYDPAVHGPVHVAERAEPPAPAVGSPVPSGEAIPRPPSASDDGTAVVTPFPYELVPSAGAIRSADVLVLDPSQGGLFVASAREADGGIAGCAAGFDERVPAGFAPLATSRIVTCRVDAEYGAIAVGDLLTTSPTPAHAMRARVGGAGTILGKAVEPLEAGTGAIRVLMALR